MESGGQSFPPPNTRWWREVELPREHRDRTDAYPLSVEWDPGLPIRKSRSLITLWHERQEEDEVLWEELIRDVDLQRPGASEPHTDDTGSTSKRTMKSGHPGGPSKVAEEPLPVFKVGYLDGADASQIFERESWELINAALEKIHATDMAKGINQAPQVHDYYPSMPERGEFKMSEGHEHKFRTTPKKLPPSSDSPVPHCSKQSPDDEKTRRYINRLEEAVRQNLAAKKKDQQENPYQPSHLSPRHKDSAFELWKKRAISFLKISEEARQKYEQIKRRRAGLPDDKQLLSYILDTMKSLGLLAMDIVRNVVLFCYLLGCMICRLALETYRAPRFVQCLLALALIIGIMSAIYLTSKQPDLMYNIYDFEL